MTRRDKSRDCKQRYLAKCWAMTTLEIDKYCLTRSSKQIANHTANYHTCEEWSKGMHVQSEVYFVDSQKTR